MRDDIPEWLGKPPLRGTDEWAAWLEKWRSYARAELRDTAADDPDFDFGLLTTEERWRVILKLEVQRQFAQGMAGGPRPDPLGQTHQRPRPRGGRGLARRAFGEVADPR